MSIENNYQDLKLPQFQELINTKYSIYIVNTSTCLSNYQLLKTGAKVELFNSVEIVDQQSEELNKQKSKYLKSVHTCTCLGEHSISVVHVNHLFLKQYLELNPGFHTC